MPKKVQKKKKGKTAPQAQEVRPKDFLDLIAPAAVKFNTDHYICGSMYHCTLALRSYPATTEELALLRHLGEKSGVTLSIYTRQVTAAEENGILHNAENKNRMARSSKGRPPKQLPKQVEEDLLAEVQRLRAENDYLKNLQALVLEDERHQHKKRW